MTAGTAWHEIDPQESELDHEAPRRRGARILLYGRDMRKLSRLFALAWLGLTACSGQEDGAPGGGTSTPDEMSAMEDAGTTTEEDDAGTATADAGTTQSTDAGAQPELEPVTLVQTSGICVGQQALVPRSRMIEGESTGSYNTRSETNVYVSYQARNGDLFAYFSFDPSLPRTPDSDSVRAMLKYAYVVFHMKQPDGVGGSLQLLSSLALLHLEDFERFEVQHGELKWRLVRQSEEHYPKPLTVYDADRSNDPNPPDDCLSDDIIGMCWCEFTGPAITVTIDGSLPLL
jgi:hypothetical protein